jgi:hypothetical protein
MYVFSLFSAVNDDTFAVQLKIKRSLERGIKLFYFFEGDGG